MQLYNGSTRCWHPPSVFWQEQRGCRLLKLHKAKTALAHWTGEQLTGESGHTECFLKCSQSTVKFPHTDSSVHQCIHSDMLTLNRSGGHETLEGLLSFQYKQSKFIDPMIHGQSRITSAAHGLLLPET